MKNVVVIGGGASGLIASIYASYKGHKVTLLERNSSALKKLLLTGNGKCNYFNSNQEIINYNSSEIDLVKNLITEDNLKDVLDFFDTIGIVPKIKNGYYYPYSNTSLSIKEALLKEAKENNVTIINNFLVEDITKEKENFIINHDNKLKFDSIILATGSKASPKTGSDGMGYELLKKFNHTIIKPLPALVQLICDGNYFKEWNGIRCDVKVSLYEDNKFVKEESGEIQLTNYGLSGICIFNLSGKIKRGLENNKKETVVINFLPFIKGNVKEWFNLRNNKVKNRNIVELLEGIINYKIVKLILKKINIKYDATWNSLTDKEKETLIRNLISFKVNVTDTNSFDNAQVCSGGVPLSEINLTTMESLKEKNLYVIGELLDIDGACGGYNLTIAWITGILAGKSI